MSEVETPDASDHGSIYASSSVSGFTASSLPRRKIIHVETSTLYQLKSEVAKTSQHVDDLKSKFGTFKAPQVSRKLLPEELKRKRKEAKAEKQNKGIDERNRRDAEELAKERATADKVRKKLEAKSRVYDRIQQGESEMDDYMRENCLVDFDQKDRPSSSSTNRDYPESVSSDRGRSRHMSYQSESDMIEHTDALGRTSYITKRELQAQVRKDKEISDLRRDEYDERYSRYSDGSRSPSPESKQARFQTMDDGDIRDLGVGYFSFSRDENERQKQMSLLETLRASTEQSRTDQQAKETAKAEKTRRFLEKKRKMLAKKRGLKVDDIAIPETDVVIDLPAPKPQDRTEMNIDRNIATAKKASRDWDKDKDMEEIYGEKGAPVARETNYYETQRNKRDEQFAPSYQDAQPYQRQQHQDNTFGHNHGGGGGYDDYNSQANYNNDNYGGGYGNNRQQQQQQQQYQGYEQQHQHHQGGYHQQQQQRPNLTNQYGNGGGRGSAGGGGGARGGYNNYNQRQNNQPSYNQSNYGAW